MVIRDKLIDTQNRSTCIKIVFLIYKRNKCILVNCTPFERDNPYHFIPVGRQLLESIHEFSFSFSVCHRLRILAEKRENDTEFA